MSAKPYGMAYTPYRAPPPTDRLVLGRGTARDAVMNARVQLSLYHRVLVSLGCVPRRGIAGSHSLVHRDSAFSTL